MWKQMRWQITLFYGFCSTLSGSVIHVSIIFSGPSAAVPFEYGTIWSLSLRDITPHFYGGVCVSVCQIFLPKTMGDWARSPKQNQWAEAVARVTAKDLIFRRPRSCAHLVARSMDAISIFFRYLANNGVWHAYFRVDSMQRIPHLLAENRFQQINQALLSAY